MRTGRNAVLVTGTNGSLGQAIGAALDQAGFAVTRHAGRIDGDLTRADVVHRVLSDVRPVAVVNAAGLTYGAADELWTANALVPLVMAQGMATLLPQSRLILLSSAAVYGLSAVGQAAFRESDPPSPNSDYGWSKLAAERLTVAVHRNTIAARIFNIDGSITADQRSLLERVRSSYAAGDDRPGGANEIRDWISPQFVAAALTVITLHPRPPAVVNICSGLGRTPADILGHASTGQGVSSSVGDPSALTALAHDIPDVVLPAPT